MSLQKRYVYGWIISVSASVILLTVLLIFLYLRAKKSKKPAESSQDDDKPADRPALTPKQFTDMVKAMLTVDNVTSLLITAHAMHETGIFTSRVFLEDNNAFGMHLPLKRETEATGQDDAGFAYYDDVQDSILDLALWFDYHKKELSFNTAENYCEYLKSKGYYEASFISYLAAFKRNLAML